MLSKSMGNWNIHLEQIYLDISNPPIAVQYHRQQTIAAGCMNFHIEKHQQCLASMVESKLVPKYENVN